MKPVQTRQQPCTCQPSTLCVNAVHVEINEHEITSGPITGRGNILTSPTHVTIQSQSTLAYVIMETMHCPLALSSTILFLPRKEICQVCTNQSLSVTGGVLTTPLDDHSMGFHSLPHVVFHHSVICSFYHLIQPSLHPSN